MWWYPPQVVLTQRQTLENVRQAKTLVNEGRKKAIFCIEMVKIRILARNMWPNAQKSPKNCPDLWHYLIKY